MVLENLLSCFVEKTGVKSYFTFYRIGFSATLMINKIRRPTKWLIDHLTMVMMLKIMKVGRWGEGGGGGEMWGRI